MSVKQKWTPSVQTYICKSFSSGLRYLTLCRNHMYYEISRKAHSSFISFLGRISISNVSMNVSSCCGFEWMIMNSRLIPGTTRQIVCNGSSLDRYPARESICKCKQMERSRNHTACYSLTNLTSWSSKYGDCGYGCPMGRRIFTTGSSLQCLDGQFPGNLFTLYETACQGKIFLF